MLFRCCLGLVVVGSLQALGHADELAAKLEAYLRPFVETDNFTGTVVVTRGGQILFERGYGLANPSFDIPNTPATRFHIASISKAFTAAAVLVLEERGKLKTTDPISKFLPDYPGGARIRLDHLLKHTSGIPNTGSFPEGSSDRYVPHTTATIVATFRDKPPDFEPGSRARYTNSGYNLLALVIEHVSGQSFGDFLRTAVLEPLSLRSTAHDGDATAVLQRSASGTEPSGLRGMKFVPYLQWSTKTGSGSIVSTGADLCTFARALFGGALLGPASLEKIMDTEGVFPYGWTDRERGGRKAKGVGGRSPGFISNLEYFLDDGTCVAILTNSYSSVGQVIAPDLGAIAIGLSATPPTIAYERSAPGGLRTFTGQFEMPANYYMPKALVTINDRGDYLEASWPRGLTTVIYPTGGDRFVDRTNWAMVRFMRDERGAVTGFTYQLLTDFVARKVGP